MANQKKNNEENKISQRDVFATISLDQNNRIKNFPMLMRLHFCKVIYDLLLDFPLSSNEFIINKIIYDILNADYWKIDIPDKSICDLTNKVSNSIYSTPIHNLLSDLVVIVKEIIKYAKDFKIIKIGNLARLITEKQNNMTTYKSEGSIYQVIRDLLVYLEESFPNLKFKRESTTYDPSMLEKIREKQIVYTYQKLQEISSVKNGRLINTLEDYNQLIINEKPSSIKFLWSCDNPTHDFFKLSPDNIKAGSWCPQCFREKQKDWQISRSRYSYEYLQEQARKRGGKLVTPKDKFLELIRNVKPSRVLLEWWCSNNEHDSWFARPHDIIIKNTWCPECAEGKYERITRDIFKNIFGKAFKKIRLNDVIEIIDFKEKELEFNEILSNLLEFGHFDGYDVLDLHIGMFKVAFEYNGPQHYSWEYLRDRYKLTDDDAKDWFNLIVKRDKLKLLLALKNNIVLIVIPFYVSERMNNYDKIYDYIRTEFKRLTGYDLEDVL